MENERSKTKKENNTSMNEITIPLHGVSLSYLLDKFTLTEEQDFNVACEQVKERTQNFKGKDRSLASFLKSNPDTSQYVKEKADVFISYAWKGSWVETMAALKHQLTHEKHDTFIWMDFVCVDQHATNDLNFKDWSRVFQTSLEEIGKAVIVVVPAENPIVPQRSWCCFEMSMMVQAQIPYDICISPNDTQKLIQDMKNGRVGSAKWNTLFSLVNVEKSTASKSTDQVNILALIKEIGVVQVNNVVQNALKKLYVIVVQTAEKGSSKDSLASVLNSRAALHQTLGDFDAALPFCQSALDCARATPNNDKKVATYLNNLAELLRIQGKYDEARPLYEQAITIFKKVLGDDHPNVATLLNNLAELLRNQGKFDEAKPLYEQAIVIFKKVLGNDHPNVATLLNNLALLLSSQGKFEKAETLQREALDIQLKTQGPDHPQYASGLNNLAVLLKSQGKFSEAEPLYQQSLAIRKKVFGNNHSSVSESLNNLAELLRNQGKFEEAKPQYEQANAIRKKALGEEHPDVASGLNNLAQLLSDQGKYDDAIPLFEQSIAIFKKALGEDHPNVATLLNNLAVLLRDQGKESEARNLGKQAYQIVQKSLGEEHPTTVSYKYWETF